jgi:3-deoxy-D-manno-octulosonate 8-phosphate phosphatase (KDO 8-P phosphatase)
VQNKVEAYNEIKRSSGLKDDQIAYVGDDIVDRPVLKLAGLAVSVADGWPELISTVDFVTSAHGGRGAVREIAELLLRAQGKWSILTN